MQTKLTRHTAILAVDTMSTGLVTTSTPVLMESLNVVSDSHLVIKAKLP